jgi:hypothetical protein
VETINQCFYICKMGLPHRFWREQLLIISFVNCYKDSDPKLIVYENIYFEVAEFHSIGTR